MNELEKKRLRGYIRSYITHHTFFVVTGPTKRAKQKKREEVLKVEAVEILTEKIIEKYANNKDNNS